MRMIRVVVVEDQTMLRDSLVAAINRELDMEVVASLSDAADVLDIAPGCEIDVALLDVCTEHNSSGIIAARKLKEVRPQVKTVIMTGMSDVTFVRQAREAGVDSFIYKNVGTEDLLSVIRSTTDGYSTFPSSRKGEAPEVELLDELELKILYLTCQAKSRREIAAELYMSEGTVKRHISEMLAKTGYDNLLKLAVRAVSSGSIAVNVER